MTFPYEMIGIFLSCVQEIKNNNTYGYLYEEI